MAVEHGRVLVTEELGDLGLRRGNGGKLDPL
jgi:hypothetical protein